MNNSSLHRFFIEEEIIDNKLKPNKELVHQIRKVLRIKDGDNFLIINNQIEYLAFLSKENLIEITKKVRENNNAKTYEINLIQSNVKNTKVNFILQKATELNVDSILFVETKRSVVKNTDYIKKKDRFEKIVLEASEQSERLKKPNINIIQNLSNLEFNNDELTLLFYAREEQNYLGNFVNKIKEFNKINILIGPEGGFDIEEVKMLDSRGAISVSLGKTILRTETASIAALSVINFIKES